jgi:hypothetical protein
VAALVELGGLAAYKANIRLPLRGAWTATLYLDVESAQLGGAVLVADGRSFHGTVVEGGSALGGLLVRYIAGAGKVGATVPGAGHRGAPLRIPLTDALTAAGETLSSTASLEALNLVLSQWSRTSGPLGGALEHLVELAGLDGWRYLPDGTVWVGTELWPEYTGEALELLKERPEVGMEVYGLALDLQPGMTLNGRRVVLVEHTVEQRLETLVSYER